MSRTEKNDATWYFRPRLLYSRQTLFRLYREKYRVRRCDLRWYRLYMFYDINILKIKQPKR